ncbi:hypothetical protein EV363DRAFT_1391600 [Boletus edulis]|nr:hypothetical protein EV363DRAFT_1408039 [Boletus edulis]KAF8121070.1 hypothetical protein EV363DRAFT_1406633 [Boletus edulis]KAF8126091.1 hypothetical protein EV363DRAFT_1402138 [Boletus edulis]KAF8132626.1 hypothetical protein EV363DRAFT_1398215 [Boletus edulis]KAF8137684.1 hypothetical protein EV363DRAFT_1395202 [Boletus edulis]
MAPTYDSGIPSDWALARTDRLATYMVSLFNHTLHPESNDAPQIPPISLPNLCEADRMVGRLVSAGWLELTEPAVITDKADSILLWYLPGAVSMPNQKLLWEKMSLLQKPLLNSIQGQHWRTSADLFKTDAAIKGAINLSPSWFQQGRHVWHVVCYFSRSNSPVTRPAVQSLRCLRC